MITSPSNYLKNDSRFKSWAKVASKSQVDLSQTGGYAIGGQWVEWNDSVSLDSGEYLVVAAETGSRANHYYSYRLINGDGNRVELEERIVVLDRALESGVITEKQRVNAKNNTLYSYALYISLR
jgi:hypothetical protein